MAKTARILGVFLVVAGFLVTMAPAVQAQTYVYPITTAYGTNYTTSYGSTGGCIVLTNYLAIGSVDLYTNGQVSQLQQYLNRAGLLSGVSGSFDWNTYTAVVAFQNAHGISPTGTVGPITRAAINQVSCGNYAAVTPVVTPVITPVVVNNNNCVDESRYYPYDTSYSSCGNSTYNYNNGYGYGYGIANVTLNSANASYSYGSITLTLNGVGFTSSDTVHFNGSTYTAYSSNGSTLTFTVPNSYYSGNYNIYVVNSNGSSSNTLSFPISSSNNSYNNGYNGSYNNTVSLSSINGATSVQTGNTNTWNVTVSNSTNNGSYYNTNQYTTITTNWGDNTNTTSQQINLSGSQNLSFSHVYSNSGTYTIRITVNNNGATSYQTLTVTAYGNNGYNYGSANISYVSPNPVSIGSTATISGSGFSSYGNTVHFGNGGTMNVSSYNGNTIYYTIPSQLSGCDLTSSNGYCAQWLTYVSSGSYPIYVTNNSGQTSNTVYVTVR